MNTLVRILDPLIWVLFFGAGIFVAALWPPEYIVPIVVTSPHNPEDMILMQWSGIEHYCYLVD